MPRRRAARFHDPGEETRAGQAVHLDRAEAVRRQRQADGIGGENGEIGALHQPHLDARSAARASNSLSAPEIGTWLSGIQAGNLYVNWGATGAIVRRQPFGGWKKSSVGPGTKAGGPNNLLGLGSWISRPSAATAAATDGKVRSLVAAARDDLSADARGFLDRATGSDEEAWSTRFASAADVSRLTAERNVFRYRPAGAPVTVRVSEGSDPVAVLRIAAAAARADAEFSVSSGVSLTAAVQAALAELTTSVVTESDAECAKRAARLPAGHIRLVGTDAQRAATEAGRLELLPFLRE